LPPAGYWAKQAHGHDVKKIPLPAIDDHEVKQIEFVMKEPSSLNELNLDGIKEDHIDKAIGHSFVTLNEFKKGFHPLIVDAQKELRERLKSQRKIEDGERIHFLNMSVTKSSTERSLSLMNLLFQVIEANGLPISHKPGYKEGTYVKVNGVDVQVELKERTKRSDNPDPKSYNKYVFHPTGILYFEFVNIYVSGARKIWSGTPTMKLEEIVNDVVLGIVMAAILDKKRDEELERRRKKGDEVREQERLKEEQKKNEQERIQALVQDAQKWQTSNIIRTYIKAVEEKYISEKTLQDINAELKDWIKWAKEKADILDPVLNQSWRTKSL
jgi:RNase P subunit RPR2